MTQPSYDAILIGSGIGALTVAIGLGQERGWRCLVLEQNFNLGGLMQAFVRQRRYHFDVGLHYVGQMAPGEVPRLVMDHLTGGAVDWTALPDRFERFVYPDFTCDVPSHPARFLATLTDAFPHEAGALRRYLRDLRRTAIALEIEQFDEVTYPALRPLVRAGVALAAPDRDATTAGYLDRHFADPRLKAVLASQWGNCALLPSQSAFGMHAMVAAHYLHGAAYPLGGADAVARAMLARLRGSGGEALPGLRVERILLDARGAVRGVRARRWLRDGTAEEFAAPVVISNAGAARTYLDLLPPEAPHPFRPALAALPPSMCAISLFLGLSGDPRAFGFGGENHWVFAGYDHEAALQGDPGERFFHLSFPSLKDGARGGHTAELLSFVDPARFATWRDTPWRQRGPAYEALKQRLTDSLLGALGRYAPGLLGMVEHCEMATPLTYGFFQDTRDGAFHRLPALPARRRWPFARCRTPIEGLYLTGADVLSPGIVGAMMGGIKCLGAMLGQQGFIRLMRKVARGTPRQALPEAAWGA